MTRCPRCGEPMNGGICDNCGFPMRRYKKIIYPVKRESTGKDKWNMKSI